MDNVKFHIKLIKMEKYHNDNLFIFIQLNKSIWIPLTYLKLSQNLRGITVTPESMETLL